MRSSECVYCKRLFNCKGKEKNEPCVCFEDRRSRDERERKKSIGTAKEGQREDS